MKSNLKLKLDDDTVRFTPEGRIFLIDVIGMLVDTPSATDFWRDLKARKPEIEAHIEYQRMSGEQMVPTTDSSGWDSVNTLLFDYLIERAGDKDEC